MSNGSKVTEAALFHLWKVLYPQHLFSSLHCAPARAKHCVRMNYMVTHVTFVSSTAHFCMKYLPTYLVDHMLLWLTFLCGPSGDAMQGIPNQASEDWQRSLPAKKMKPWLDSFPRSLRRRDQNRKTLLTDYFSCTWASNKSLFLANFSMHYIMVKNPLVELEL